MTRQTSTARIKVGGTVAFTAEHLLNTCLFNGDLDRATGQVIALNPDKTHAEVLWGAMSSTVRTDSLQPVNQYGHRV
jgi:hypothetical protein